MNSLLAITARELRLRWTLLPAALSLGFVPLLGPVLGFTLPEPGLVGLVLSLLMGALAALLTGASVIGGDLGSRRLGFFFSRPLPWWAIWGGKILAAVMLTLGAGLLAAVPWLASGRGGPLRLASLWDLQGAVVALGWVLVSVGASHAASVAFRSRSAWLLVDLGLLAALVLLVRVSADLMLLGGIALAPGQSRIALRYLHLPIGLALLTAGAVQMARGRTVLRRGHLALSVSLWPLLFFAIGSLAGFGLWVRSAAPQDLEKVVVAGVAPQANWISLAGPARGRGSYWPAFLYDVTSARYVRLQRAGIPLSFSPRRERVALLDLVLPPGKLPEGNLTLVDLAEGTPTTRSLRLALVPMAGSLQKITFGPAGDRLALVQQRALSVYELSSGRVLGSAPAGSGEWLWDAVFLDDDRLRGLRRTGAKGTMVEIVEIRLPGGQTEVTGQVATTETAWTRSDDAAKRLLVFHQTERRLVTLHDARSGSLLRTLTDPNTDRGADVDFLSDGRIAVASAEGDHSLLRVCRRDGTEERRLQLGAGWGLLGGEPAPGRLYVGLRGAPSQSHTVLVDLDQGSILRREKGLFPAAARRSGPRYGLVPRPRTGTPGAALFVSDDGELVRLDPTTGERTVLLGGKGGD